MRLIWPLAILGLVTAGCRETLGSNGAAVAPPSNLIYTVEPSGTPGSPSGILLHWDYDNSSALAVWHVYSRANTADAYGLRGSTTSNTFHDNGVPHLQYYVTAEDDQGIETGPSNVVTVDERLALDAPAWLNSTSLNGAIALDWADNAFQAEPQGFKIYRVYSTPYDLDQGTCGATWVLEGTTVSPEFVAGALPNGVPRCFGVSAESIEGFESLWSPIRDDTPRPDARNVLIYARQTQDAGSGFRFWRDLNNDQQSQPGELGLISSGSASDIDFSVERDVSGALFLTPVRTGTAVQAYGSIPVEDLTGVDFAPLTGYSTLPIQAVPGWGYVFEMDEGDGFYRYGAVRVTHVGQDYLILDWAYQTDPGNPELVRGGR